MKIEQIYTGCLAQGAYYISSDGEGAIIDPLREVDPYLKMLKNDDVQLKYIFETHFHADFVSGHVTLANRTGAPIVYGPLAETTFDAIIATDKQTFPIGKGSIEVLHTPGHTMESTCYLLRDENNESIALFSGDTLFLGDVGRPDLAQKGVDLTTEILAGILYDSLRNKIMPLSDTIIVYPGHGAGSACGKNMSTDKQDTLGNQKKTNYALRSDMSRKEFIKEVTDGMVAPPAYFPMNVGLNKNGYMDIDKVIEKGLKPLNVQTFKDFINKDSILILDIRSAQEFATGHIPNSIFVGLKGGFAPWVGSVIENVNTPILLVANKGQEEEAVIRLARVGFDHVLGYLEGGFPSWKNSNQKISKIQSINAQSFINLYNSKEVDVYDVRKEGEYVNHHLPNAVNIPLSQINNSLQNFNKEKTIYIHCQGGYRSMIASSILKRKGFGNIIDIAGGFQEILKLGSTTESEFTINN